jgi:hypothetical protein
MDPALSGPCGPDNHTCKGGVKPALEQWHRIDSQLVEIRVYLSVCTMYTFTCKGRA